MQSQLRISRIVLENFKSWFGQHIIELDPQKFTAIVGANGSGKSNIIDALLFVFGWRARQLRQAKATDLIHFSHEQPDFARVQIDFVNVDSAFAIARVIRKSGQSFYEVNGQRTTLEAVQQILLDNGLDTSHNRFLILQGEVESISMMKPAGDDLLSQMTQQQLMNLKQLRDLCEKLQVDFDPTQYHLVLETVRQKCTEPLKPQFDKIIDVTQLTQSEQGLLEFIEQVIGTNEQVPTIAFQAALVEFINEVKLEIRQSLTAAVQYRDQLNQQKDEAVGKLKKYSNDAIEQLRSDMYEASSARIQIVAKKNDSDELQRQIDLASGSQIRELEARLEHTTREIAQLDHQFAEEKHKCTEDEEAQKQLIVQQKLTCDKMNSLTKDTDETAVKVADVEKQLDKLVNDFNELPIKAQNIDTQIGKLQNQIAAKEDQLQKQQTESEQNNAQINQVKEQIAGYEKKLQPIAQVRAQQQSRLEIARKQAGGRLNQLVDQAIVVATTIGKINQHINYKNPKLQKLVAQVDEAKQLLATKNLQKQKNKLDLLNKELQTVNLDLQTIDLKIDEINSQRQDSTKQSKLLTTLMAAVRSNVISGVHGRLGNLGKIDPSLNVAAIAAFGGQLDYIVCDSMSVIQQCLDFIRERGLGYASFIDLEQVSKRYQQQQSQIDVDFVTQNQAAMFLNLVQSEALVRPAFWHVMGETVVCDTTDQAIYINKNNGSKQKIRVVTKDGELFERSGSLTGGSIKGLLSKYSGFVQQASGSQTDLHDYQREKQGLSIRQENLSTQVETIERDLKEYDALKQQIDSLNEDISAQQYEATQITLRVKTEISNIKQVNENAAVQFCGGFVNPLLMEELNTLERSIAGQQIINTNKCRELIPAVCEMVDYYQKQKLVTEEQFRHAIRNVDPLDILEGESDLANLIQFNAPLVQTLQIANTEGLKQEVDQLLLQERAYEDQISALQEKINKFGNVKAYAALRKEIQQLQQTLTKLQGEQKQIAVQEARFGPQKERLSQTHQELSEKLEQFHAQLQAISAELENKNQLVQQQKQILNQQQHILQQTAKQLKEANDQKTQIESQLSAMNSQLLKMRQQMAQNADFCVKALEQMTISEQHAVVVLALLDELQRELQKADELLEFQTPLFAGHENIEELDSYDQMCFAQYQQLKKSRNYNEVNLNALFITEFRVLTDYAQRVQQLMKQQQIFSQVQKDYDDQQVQLNALKDTRSQQFMTSFNEINSRLREIYRVFSMGGDATLELADAFDPFQGLNYSVMPPKKAWRTIQNLSGGEKTLSSLSLIFALHQYRKNFIYVVDEIDAALDFRNVSLVANYLKEQAKECQFVIISLRNNTFEVADSLIGVYKVDNMSRCVALDLE